MRKIKPKVKEQAHEGQKVLTRDEILSRVASVPTRFVTVEGWDAAIKMQNIDFEKLIEMRQECQDERSYKAGLVACTCEALELTDVCKLMNANGFKFALLWAAVARFHGLDKINEESIKN